MTSTSMRSGAPAHRSGTRRPREASSKGHIVHFSFRDTSVGGHYRCILSFVLPFISVINPVIFNLVLPRIIFSYEYICCIMLPPLSCEHMVKGRSPEDEKYLSCIVEANPASKYLYIVDTRPKINALYNRSATSVFTGE
jgi:hypothetical protein